MDDILFLKLLTLQCQQLWCRALLWCSTSGNPALTENSLAGTCVHPYAFRLASFTDLINSTLANKMCQSHFASPCKGCPGRFYFNANLQHAEKLIKH